MTYMKKFLGMLWDGLKLQGKQLYEQQKENNLMTINK